ncbi:DUF2339 domain-containing protein [Psychrobacter immobilis]|uniref:DUF2339 domain-containing protein n=1 Tax=Psychrobacter immobilis TaxID=498 RepID=UPI001917D6C5|nr:DUF2339 domain-containing protein [Psychrobacter immobilis]
MLYLLINPLGWLAFTILLIIVVVLYVKITRQIEQLRHDMTELQAELEQHKDSVNIASLSHSAHINATQESRSESAAPSTVELAPSAVIISEPTEKLQSQPTSPPELPKLAESVLSKPQISTSAIEPDEHSTPIVTSLIHSVKNWFFGGNLVVRVGVLVLLVGVVLLLRLLSDYIEIPVALKLMSIGIIGLGLAALGLKLAKNRFAYGITLQGAGLAIAYLTTFFAYSVYQVLASVPSFIGLGILSAITIGLAVRQNALPLALLALSGGFFAPILTSSDIGNLVTLFSYYLLLNVTIAVIAHYRTWKMLNLLGVVVTFGLAYYWGATENLSAVIEAQRWSLVSLVALHVLLYLFVVIRYAQQLIAYNALNEEGFTCADSVHNINTVDKVHRANNLYIFPIDTGLLFSVPILAFGLFAALLEGISNALTITSAVLAVIYLSIGWVFVQRSQRYALITEGMLALGFGFLALVIPLAFDAEWIAFGWSVQGLALVWFGRRSLRAWSVLFGLLLQLLSIAMLMINILFTIKDYPTLALTISALSYLATMFILRASNSPAVLDDTENLPAQQNTTAASMSDSTTTVAQSIGISSQAAQQWLTSIDSQSVVFKVMWRSPILSRFLTFTAMGWLLYVLIIDFDQWFVSWQLATTALLGLATLTSLIIYQAINHYHSWREIRQFSHGLLLIFYAMLIFQLPQNYEFSYQWTAFHWPIFITLLIGWLVVGQLWLRTWHKEAELKAYDSASWLGAGIILLAEAMHYGLPDSKGVMTILVPVAFMLIGLYVTYRHIQSQKFKDDNIEPKTPSSAFAPYWFDWHQALLDSAKIFVPMTLGWAIFTNFTYDGVIWRLPYFPLFNLYDVTLWLVVFYGLSIYLLRQPHGMQSRNLLGAIPKNDMLLIILALIGLWIGSSMLVRTLHAFIGTPLWIGGLYNVTGGAWNSEKVQTGLTILWTLIALVATIIASRYGQRTLWFMGIGLLGIVVLKLVLVDLSQTEAIWRVISFLGAGSLTLVIGYLAPLPPAREDLADEPE